MRSSLFHICWFWGTCLVICTAARAETLPEAPQTQEMQTLFGEACERVKPQETISSIRMRATDKATFEAVKNLDYITNLQNKYDDHDLNVLIYKIVDNYVEDLGVQTTQQDDAKICVEVTGYVTTENIFAALDEMQNEHSATAETQTAEPALDTTESSVQTEVEPLSNPTAADDASSVSDDASSAADNAPAFAAEGAYPSESVAQETQASVKTNLPASRLLYIAPLEFYNHTQSKEYVKILNRVFEHNAYFELTDDENAAGYVIISKVLRAKVDALNRDTNRMQMVVSVEVKNKLDGSSAIEHQNRFILFKSTDDEQKVAAGLMQKLLTKAAKLILNKTERMAQVQAEKNGDAPTAFITPKEAASSAPWPDALKPDAVAN